MGDTRETEFWAPQPLWPSRPTAFLLGGGASLRGFDVEQLRGRRIVAINSSVHMAARIAGPLDVLYFTDNSWFENHLSEVRDWPGLVFTGARRAKAAMPDRVHRLEMFECSAFQVPGKMRNGPSSGHIVVSLAIALGAGRLALLGYDMRLVDGRSHHHDDYGGRVTEQDVLNGYLAAFHGWHQDALDVGVTVMNLTPGSALMEFPLGTLDEELQRPR